MTHPDQLRMSFPEARHAHLKLATALSPGPRRKRKAGFGGQVRHADRAGHARDLQEQTLRVTTEYRARASVLGVDPELVLVLELNRRADLDIIQRAGLSPIEITDDKVIVAFASDPALTKFEKQRETYAAGPRERPEADGEGTAAYEQLFDGIEKIRNLRPEDVIDRELAAMLADLSAAGADRLVRLDVQCWCPEDEADARRRHDDAKRAVQAAGGIVLDSSLRTRAGLSLLRIDVLASHVPTLAEVDRIRRIDLLPRPQLSYPEVRQAGPDDLPPVLNPAAFAPILAVIDSGIRSAHPLLAPAVIGMESIVPGLADDGDESGHGTLVASLGLYGSLEQVLADRIPLQPAGRLLGLKVLDADSAFPDDRLWEEHLLAALERAADAGARVINLSLGDQRRPYHPPRPTPLAAALDSFIAEHPNVVVVISAGNYSPANYLGSSEPPHDYPVRIVEDELAGLLDPASAALALTVGALCPDDYQGARPARNSVSIRPLGRPGEPSPVTRRGPGAMQMVKPEICAPGGSIAWDNETGRWASDSALQVTGAGGFRPEQLLAAGIGTSYAAPLASHAALRVFGRYPLLSGNGARALLLASSTPGAAVISTDGPGKAEVLRKQRQLTGYGRVSAERAEASTDHRAVLLAEDELTVDGVHLYSVPLPSTFFMPGGQRTLTVALAYDPPTRPTRMDYLASRMEVRAFRKISVSAVATAYSAQMADPERTATDRPDRDVPEDESTPATIRKFDIGLDPTDRFRGANQVGIKVFKQAFNPQQDAELVVVVRNTSRWDVPGAHQRYALAVALERDNDHAPLYAELQAHLEVISEVELEVE
jgi:Subtilase family